MRIVDSAPITALRSFHAAIDDRQADIPDFDDDQKRGGCHRRRRARFHVYVPTDKRQSRINFFTAALA